MITAIFVLAAILVAMLLRSGRRQPGEADRSPAYGPMIVRRRPDPVSVIAPDDGDSWRLDDDSSDSDPGSDSAASDDFTPGGGDSGGGGASGSWGDSGGDTNS